MKLKAGSLKRLHKIDKHLDRLAKKKRELAQINQIRNEKEEITRDTTEIEKVIRDYHKKLHANKMDNLEEMNKLLERNNLPRLNQE